ncbi:hypothetical protein T01_14207, partial [Trichinella spiralis]
LKYLLYAGRSREERHIGLASTNVRQLAQPFVNSNKNNNDDQLCAKEEQQCSSVDFMPRKVQNRRPVRCDKRPNIINDYNLGKGCVDSMDARIEDFCCIRKTNRYTMLMLYFIVEVCINNAFLLMKHQQR